MILKEGEKLLRGSGMQRIIDTLTTRGVHLKALNAIEVFGGEGDWHTHIYSTHVASLEAWEINPEFARSFKENVPEAKLFNRDSVKYLQSTTNVPTGGLVVIDNPQSLFGDHNNYCEHFDIIMHVTKLIRKKCIIVFNVNLEPFDYINQLEWKHRRESFYGIKKTDKLSLSFLYKFYDNYFRERNLKTEYCYSISRMEEHNKPIDYLHYLVCSLRKAH